MRSRILWLALLLTAICRPLPAARGQETALTSEERAKLDTFEGVSIDKADKVFAAKDWPRAVAEYDAFIVQFPESKVTPYAILRKGRAMQEELKRFEAIQIYQEVLDFFPDDVKYAAAALYRIGECHMQNGTVAKAMKAWFELSEDADYVQEPVGAPALNGLAENLIKQGKADEGIKRFEQVAVEFRSKNGDAARAAIARVVPYHIRTKPDVKKLRDFYVAVKTFHNGPQQPGADIETDAEFWRFVREYIESNSQFSDVQKAERDAFYRYWAGQMQGKFPANDDFQLSLANYIRAYDFDETAWMARLDKQFANHQKEGDYGRITRWIGMLCKPGSSLHKAKVEEYYRKLDFAKMPHASVAAVVSTLLQKGGDPALAANTFAKLRLDDMTDDEKQAVCNWMKEWNSLPGTRDFAVRACLSFKDASRGKMALLRYYHWRCLRARGPSDLSDGLALAAEMQKVPANAKESFLIGANMLQLSAKYEDAIKAYRQADSPPGTLYSIADCLVALGKLAPAVAQLKEIENFFPDQASAAALKIAYLYRDAGIKEKYVRSLRGVLKKYPKSGESSQAHQRLEEMGLPIGGGVDAEE
jgi:tetratricopeptide (TPR) repeat protein